MNAPYTDIRSRIAEAPAWWDENAVPRYGPFTPDACADIYASEAVLALVACQNCDREFPVAFTWGPMDMVTSDIPPLHVRLARGGLNYGDPPNVGCCPAGSTMNCEFLRVLESWRKGGTMGDEWIRLADTATPAVETIEQEG